MKILGLSAFYHDSAAVLLDAGEIVAAAQEERFTRKRFDPSFPAQSVAWCLKEAGCTLADVDYVAFHDKPLLKFARLVATQVAFAPKGAASFRKAMPLWLGGKMFQGRQIRAALRAVDPSAKHVPPLLFAEHHQSHAAAAFYPSPFDEALVLTIDGVGEWATTSVAIGRGNTLEVVRELHFPHSLGLLYAAVTQYLGFKVLSGEYKVMGLAPYGTPRFNKLFFEHLIDLRADGSFRLDQRYFDYCVGGRMTNPAFAALFGQPSRTEDQPLTQFHMDVAASVQAVTEEVVLRMVRALTQEFGIRNLCMAGGVALNCVANGKILRDGAVSNLWVQPASGDAGSALGAAQAVWHQHLGRPRTKRTGGDAMRGALLGPSWDQRQTGARLAALGAVFDEPDEAALIAAVVEALCSARAVGWFQGRMEFGPRALGARSILADARSPHMQRLLNLKVKNRESFRPFAPCVLAEDAADWFELGVESPYMLLVADVHPARRHPAVAGADGLFGLQKLDVIRSDIPAVTHVDMSARVQTVSAGDNPRFHRLLTAFKARTGCPVLVNTSFNVRGEPIVCSPEDAYHCFMGTEIDLMAAENCLLYKERQPQAAARSYKFDLEPD